MHVSEIWKVSNMISIREPPYRYGVRALLYATGFYGLSSVVVPVDPDASNPSCLDSLDVKLWLPTHRRATFFVEDRWYTAFVVGSLSTTTPYNLSIHWLTSGMHAYRGDILVVKHSESEEEVFDADNSLDREMIKVGLKWILGRGKMPLQCHCIDL